MKIDIAEEIMEIAHRHLKFPLNNEIAQDIVDDLEDNFPEYTWGLESAVGQDLIRINMTDDEDEQASIVIGSADSTEKFIQETIEKPTLH